MASLPDCTIMPWIRFSTETCLPTSTNIREPSCFQACSLIVTMSVELDAAFLERLEHAVGRHQLGEAGRLLPRVGLERREHAAAVVVDHDEAAGLELRRRRDRRSARAAAGGAAAAAAARAPSRRPCEQPASASVEPASERGEQGAWIVDHAGVTGQESSDVTPVRGSFGGRRRAASGGGGAVARGGDGLREVVDGARVQEAAVVARDRVEIGEADAVLGAVGDG